MDAPWLVLSAITAVALVYILFPVVGDVFLRFRARRSMTCPETGANAEVGLDARQAALTAAYRHPILRVKSCSLWPGRSGCEQSCLGLLEEEPTKPRSV